MQLLYSQDPRIKRDTIRYEYEYNMIWVLYLIIFNAGDRSPMRHGELFIGSICSFQHITDIA